MSMRDGYALDKIVKLKNGYVSSSAHVVIIGCTHSNQN